MRGISTTREMEIARAKRPLSPGLSDIETSLPSDDAFSDYEITTRVSGKQLPKKKARLTKTATSTASRQEAAPQIPKAYQSEESHELFSAKWFKEVSLRDEFWLDLKKKIPKSVWNRRFRVNLVTSEGSPSKGTANVTKAIATQVSKTPATKTTASKTVMSKTIKKVELRLGAVKTVPGGSKTGASNVTSAEHETADIGDDDEKVSADSMLVKATDETTSEFHKLRANREQQEAIWKSIKLENENRDEEEKSKQERFAKKERRAAAREKVAAELLAGKSVEKIDSQEPKSIVEEVEEGATNVKGDDNGTTDEPVPNAVGEVTTPVEESEANTCQEKQAKPFEPTKF